MNYQTPTRMEVLTNAVRHNYNVVKKLVGPKREIFAVIKADAYGHGAVKLAGIYKEEGCRNFAVARIIEAVELREAGVTEAILVLGQAMESAIDAVLHYNITCACAEMDFLRKLNEAAGRQHKKALVHIKVNTGMNRIGFTPQDLRNYVDEIFSMQNITVDGIFTHFAVADEPRSSYTEIQFARFKEALALLDKKGYHVRLRHACNSAAIIVHSDKYLDAVRPGIMLYGSYPLPMKPEKVHLMPTFALKSVISSIHDTEPSNGIGYGLRYVTRGKERIAVIPMGYGDGWTRTLSMKFSVLIRGKRCPGVGSICMDQLMIDISDLDNAEIGDEVVFIGTQGRETITVEEVAELRGTIPHEIPIALQSRVRREYL